MDQTHFTPVGVEAAPDALLVKWLSSSGAYEVSRHLNTVLRANCLCESCRHKDTNQRLVDIANVPTDIALMKVSLEQNDSFVGVTWGSPSSENTEPHASFYPTAWLLDHSHLKRESLVGSRVTLWDSTLMEQGRIPSVRFDDMMDSDRALYHALEAFKCYGFFIVRDAPTEHGVVERICDRIGYVKTTHYGRTFEVKAKRKPESFAYTPERLGFHTDLPYRDDTPGVQLLHCIENSADGGESLLMDGFKAATDLKAASPEAYQLLTTCPVIFTWQKEEEIFFSASKCIVQLEPMVPGGSEAARGERLSGLSFDNRNMSLSFAYQNNEQSSKELFCAYQLLATFINDAKNKIEFKMNPGDVQVFDNRRVLHAREKFDPRTGDRLLEGCYMDLDVVHSKRRALAKKLFGVVDARYTTPQVLEQLKTARDGVVEGPE